MVKFLRWFFGLFSSYVHPFERKVDRFFRGVKSSSAHTAVRRELLKLMQKNLVVLSVWMEKKYKGYKYLSKGVRRKMYEDTEKIVREFEHFSRTHKVSRKQVESLLGAHALSFPGAYEKKILYLAQIMLFLQPGKYYRYIKTASFGKLLRDPREKKLEGDCNQIVTLYAYLYSLKFPLKDLQIKLLSDHVCLHFQGIDIEATNAQFALYKDFEHILPVTEIVSTNLLDVSDFREKVQEISPRTMVKASQLAYAISSLKELVGANLEISYHNLAVAAAKSKDFKAALFFASKMQDKSLYDSIKHDEAVYYYKGGNYEKAAHLFQDLGDEESEKACYGQRYNQLLKIVKNDKTVKDARRNKSTYKRMLSLARKIGDSSLEKSLTDTLRKI